ncbi:MAG: M15 family metallopeptidase [Bacteroidetes bacterium]|nr:M15 family metallopeptidase [Bacteroidota bacterium]
MNRRIYFLFFCFYLFIINGCSEFSDHNKNNSIPDVITDTIEAGIKAQKVEEHQRSDFLEEIKDDYFYSETEESFINKGLIDIHSLDSTIIVDLKYSGTDNFMQADVYGNWQKGFLQPDVAEKLVIAQHLLKSKFPEYSLIVFDAVRPVSVQQKMWDMLDMPINEKTKYVSNPKNGSLHNFGAAIDVSIVNEFKEELDMGTPFDFFGELAYPVKEKEMLEKGKLSQEQINNRKLLREVMQKAGFFNIQTEWWHFNSCTRSQAREKYELIN